ncbi:hypothetical protein K470DRAFT_255435 [Piedraia hortae CBS 480.64]|uniref:DUF8004 domain-containing protein n=1 Tax=Piedraia hortae CBS 480.64 TaxID=1314780 RepID=A0A6A7C6A7_9PEZI|nr:hypothetical protein K470DRAFT_255435 [Piedraia hortae CBS 480.64]
MMAESGSRAANDAASGRAAVKKSRRLSNILSFGLVSNDPLLSPPADSNSLAPSDAVRPRSKSPGMRSLLRKSPPPLPPTSQVSQHPPQLPLPQHQDTDAADSLTALPMVNSPRESPRSRDTGGDSFLRTVSSQNFSRPATPKRLSRTDTPTLQVPELSPVRTRSSSRPGTSGMDKSMKRRSFFGRIKKEDEEQPSGPQAWIAGHQQKMAYDHEALLSGLPMTELWDEEGGNCYVYLFPRNTGTGASFKIDSALLASSPVLTRLAFGRLYSQGEDPRQKNLSVNDLDKLVKGGTVSSGASQASHARTASLTDNTQETHLYLPIKLSGEVPSINSRPNTPVRSTRKGTTGQPVQDQAAEDFQILVDVRNFFAFLSGQSLVATDRKSSFFQIFLSIAGILKTYGFTNVDGSTFGEVADHSFNEYVDEIGLADVRGSREKTIEGVVLGERMRSVLLYNEAFTHAVGKYDDIIAMRSPKFSLMSSITQNRLTRAAMDLEKRVASIRLILTNFELPSLFTGLMNSKVSEERKEGVRFDEWKNAWFGMRKWMIALLNRRYGHWPPRASSKKNHLETSGLNRAVCRELYDDMSAMYDLLVDRTQLTTRTVDGVDTEGHREEPAIRALRAVLSEYDRSMPPVKPPIPFDLPLLPTLHTTRPDYGRGDPKKDAKARSKKLKEDEVAAILRAARNADVEAATANNPFLNAFREMERRAAKSCNVSQMRDLRIGQWLFMYVVIQALPMLVVDAPGIRYGEKVEYFLCAPPRSGVPWAMTKAPGQDGVGGQRRTWFAVGEGGGVVSLPSDLVEHGVEGVFRRSHCWVQAEKWVEEAGLIPPNSQDGNEYDVNPGGSMDEPSPPDIEGDLPPPPRIRSASRPRSMGAASKRMSSFGIGLEALPLPAGVAPDEFMVPPLPLTPGADWTGEASSLRGMPRPRSMHLVDTSRTFDAILADVKSPNAGKKEKKKRW